MSNGVVFADLHIHIGRTQTGRPVKISASSQMTIRAILDEASRRKGLGMIGVIDCHVPEVLQELDEMIRNGEASELTGGGLRYRGTTLILGTEMEVCDDSCQGPLHVLCYFPDLDTMARFSQWMSRYQKNIELSSQRSYVKVRQLQKEVRALEGLFIPAHIFTPYKSVYGKGVKVFMSEVFNLDEVDGVELGLSSDSDMADQLPELEPFPFLSNSDAHSLSKIGREYQKLHLPQADFFHLKEGLRRGKAIAVNYGLDPKLGKYYGEVSVRIQTLACLQKEFLYQREGDVKVVKRDTDSIKRPPYVHQVPLEFIPGLGPKRLNQLIERFGSEMYVLHYASPAELEAVLPREVAQTILVARSEHLPIIAGGKGRYGRVSY